jgi:hypothetical protein
MEADMRNRLIVALVLTAALAGPLQAGVIFGRKKAQVDPKVRVPELVGILRADKDAGKRSRAAEELRYHDPAAFPDIVPALINALLADTHQAVRIDAAITLGKYRPVQQAIGEALEQALEKDHSMRVRLQARTQLLQYYWAGYRSSKKEMPPLPGKPAPETARGFGRFMPPIRTTTPTPPAPTPTPPGSTTKEPPLAPGTSTPMPATPLPMPVEKPAPAPFPAPPSLSGPQPRPAAPPPVSGTGPILPD